jgi:hypothetical protein
VTEGPWLFNRLPVGKYSVTATAEGKTLHYEVHVTGKVLAQANIFWKESKGVSPQWGQDLLGLTARWSSFNEPLMFEISLPHWQKGREGMSILMISHWLACRILVAAVPAEYLLLSVVFVLSPGFRILYSHSNSQSAGGTQEP